LIIFAFWMRKGLAGLIKIGWSWYFDRRKRIGKG